MKITKTVFALSLVTIASVFSAELKVGDVTVELIGRSGQMKLCTTGNCTESFIKVKLAKLEEYDTSGKKVQAVSAFASQDFVWGSPVVGNVPNSNLTGTIIEFTSTVKVGGNGPNAPTASFDMQVIIFQENGTVMNGNQTLYVPKDSMKFTMQCEDWPFLDAANKLHFGVTLTYKDANGDEGGDANKNVTGNNGTAAVHFGSSGLYIEAPV